MFADEIRRAVEAAARVKLPDVAALLWRAYGQGQVTEAEAEQISARIEERKIVPAAGAPIASKVGSRPRTDASMERRRKWASSGRLPPQIAAVFTLAEQAALSVVGAEVAKRGRCELCHEAVAAIAGVSRSTVRAALRRARSLGFLSAEERRLTPWRSLTNVVRIISAQWKSWIRRERRPTGPNGLCVKSPPPAVTQILGEIAKRGTGASQEASDRRKAEPAERIWDTSRLAATS